ncbi:MAG: hypothetical protein Q9218_002794 [Villophora microphyllina]
MLSTSVNAQALAFLAALTTPAFAQRAAYFTFGSSALVTERLDPLLSPGATSGHVHSVIGGSAFSSTMDFASTQSSKCTSVDIIADKSNYWMPNLYFNKGGKFTRVPETSPKHKIYYKFGNGDGSPDLQRSEFPQGFRMMAGNSDLRSDDGSMGSAGNQLNWQCHGPGGQRATGFPTGFTSCNGNNVGGLAATMRFPSCWNGQPFNKDAPMAHMSYPVNKDGLAGCPTGFTTARFPEVMIEYWLDTSPFDGQYGANESPWVLSNGDPTGYGFHMDFLNGWQPGVLAKAMKTCDAGNTGLSLDSAQCFGAGSIQSGAAKDACTIAPSVTEDIGATNPLSKLPGCNPIQSGPALATKATNCAGGGTVTQPTSVFAPIVSSHGPSTTQAATVVSTPATTATTAGRIVGTTTKGSSSVATSTASVPVAPTTSNPSGPGPTGTNNPSLTGSSTGLTPPSVNSTSGVWKAAGCFVDALNPRSLGQQAQWWGHPITSSNCVEHCDSIGAKYAGTENGGQCFCGNQLLNSASRPGKCTTKCSGDPSEICGGPALLSLYSLDGTAPVSKRTHQRHSRHFKGVL